MNIVCKTKLKNADNRNAAVCYYEYVAKNSSWIARVIQSLINRLLQREATFLAIK